MGFLLSFYCEIDFSRFARMEAARFEMTVESLFGQPTTHNSKRNIVISSLFLLFFLISCSNNLPEDILPGEHKCEFCKMGVVNQNYHSQILTKKGRRFHFDSIECMFSFWNHNSEKVEKVWVKNYQSPKEWIEIHNAKFLKADNLPSPMAANLSSYKTQTDAEDNRVLYGGKIMTQEEVMEYVKTNWEKELAGKRE